MTTMRHPLRAITLSVVVAHAAALALVDASPPRSVPARPARHQSHVMLTRPAAPVGEPTAPPPLKPDPGTMALAPEPAQAEQPETLPTEPAPEASALVDAPNEPTPDSGDTYLPRPLLTTAPRPASTVIVPFPDALDEPGRYATTLALFIDEDGVVRRVRIDGPALPKALETAARDTFLQTHFRPGEIDGRSVKSLIRIEVVFDNTPTDSASGSAAL